MPNDVPDRTVPNKDNANRQAVPEGASRGEVESARDSAAGGKRQQKTWYLTKEVIDRANGAVYWSLPLALAGAKNSGEDVDHSQIPDSASALVELALWAEILRLELLFNNGRPFPSAPGKLRTGPGQSGVSRLSEQRGPRSRGPGVPDEGERDAPE